MWVVFTSVHLVAPTGLYSSPEWTSQTIAIGRAFLFPVAIVGEDETRGVQLVTAKMHTVRLLDSI